MSLMVISLVMSLILLVVVFAVARSRSGLSGVCWLTAVTTVFSVCAFSPAFFVQSLCTLLLAFTCAALRLGPRAVTYTSVGAMLASYALMLAMSLGELHGHQRLREQYPLQSVAQRLAYEKQRVHVDSPAPVLSRQIERRLSQFDFRGRSNTRSYQLERLHDRTRDDFVMARGFGPVRMAYVRTEGIELPEAPPIPLPVPPEPEPYQPITGEPPPPLAMPQRFDRVRPSQAALLTMHDAGLEDFLGTERMGYIRDRDHVAGFEPHRFLAVPMLSDMEPAKKYWQVVKLQLVSLLKHETPVAYVSQHLPQMDELKDAPTRPLDGFERGAIDRLRTEDLVIDESPNRIRMVGSLRAAKGCVECHSVRLGDLLGAFSYELIPDRGLPVQKDAVQKNDGNRRRSRA